MVTKATIAKEGGLVCRWGIIGCGPDAARFAAELQQTAASTSKAPSADLTPVRHMIVAVGSSDVEHARSFADVHIRGPNVDAFGTSTELHAHPAIDALYIDGPHPARYAEATSALRAGKAALLYKPISMSAAEASQLCALAQREKGGRWLGMIMRKGSEGQDLRWAANQCAMARATSKVESESLPWSDALHVLEALDEIRLAEQPPSSYDEAMARHKLSLSDGGRHVDGAASSSTHRSPSRSSEMTDSMDDSITNGSTAALRAQVQELKHVLRQKSAIIASLEQRQTHTGAPSTVDGRPRPALRSRMSMPANAKSGPYQSPTLPSNKGRSSSISSENATPGQARAGSSADSPSIPFADVANTADGHGGPGSVSGIPVRRRRKDANSISIPNGYTTPDQSVGLNALGLRTSSTTQTRRTSTVPLGEGFLSPTIASENRRLATALGSPVTFNQAQFPPTSPSGTPKGSSKVIEVLHTDLQAARTALDEAKVQLRTSQRTVTTLQKTLDDTRDALARSRMENEGSGQMMSRKDRQHQEVLDRARKAEAEARELGKSSREWGARVRKIEAELGEERVAKQRAEMQYEAITATWKQTREAWEREMKDLRMTHGETAKRNREALAELETRYQQVDQEGRKVHAAVALLEEERRKAAQFVLGPVADLVKQLEQHEAHTTAQDDAVAEVQSELKRILRLMRAPVK